MKQMESKKASACTTNAIAFDREGLYFVRVTATGAKKEKNSHYTLAMREDALLTGHQNNSRETATVLAANEAFSGCIAAGTKGAPDKVDWIDLANYDSLNLAVDTGKVTVAFYNESGKKCKVGSLVQSNGTEKKNITSITLQDGKIDSFQIGALDDSLRYLEITTSEKKELSTYHITMGN